MTITDKLNRRAQLARRYFEAAVLAFHSGAHIEDVQPQLDRYLKAARLVDLTAQKAIEERSRG